MGSVFAVEVEWPKDVATSKWMPPLPFAIYTTVLTIIFVAFLIINLSDNLPTYGWFYLVFLTNLTLLLETLCMICITISTWWGYMALKNPSEGSKAPLFVRFSVVTWYLSNPGALIVVILYWTVVNQFWDPYSVGISSWWAHLIDWIVLSLHFFACNISFRFKNSIWAVLWGLAYGVWTIIHYFLQIGKGIPCDQYETEEECPIYNAFDWNYPGTATGVASPTVDTGFLQSSPVSSTLRMGFVDALDLHQIFMGRAVGAVFGTMLGGWLCDVCPIKMAMSCCIASSALSVVAVPFAAATESISILCGNFFLLGCVGSALVSFTVSAACWSFPGKEVGPVLATCNGAFGLTSAALPLIFKYSHLQGQPTAEYGFVAICSIPPLAFLLASQAPTRPVEKSIDEIEDESQEPGARQRAIRQWMAVFAAAVAQFLFAGANSALLSWIVSYSANELKDASIAPLLVSLLQGSLMLGSFGASSYQRHFALWDLTRGQVLLVLAGLLLWLPFAQSVTATVLALAWYGLAGGPLVTYGSTLLNQHCSPSGLQLAVINVGGNFGMSAGPFLVGMWMIKFGPTALPCTVSYAFMLALLGFVAVSINRHSKPEPLLGA